VAATKSVMEQALFYRALLELATNTATLESRLTELSGQVEEALTLPIDAEVIANHRQTPRGSTGPAVTKAWRRN